MEEKTAAVIRESICFVEIRTFIILYHSQPLINFSQQFIVGLAASSSKVPGTGHCWKQNND